MSHDIKPRSPHHRDGLNAKALHPEAPKTKPLAVSRKSAAALLDVSLSFFERHIQPEIALVYKGRRRLVPVVELERWLERNAIGTRVTALRDRQIHG